MSNRESVMSKDNSNNRLERLWEMQNRKVAVIDYDKKFLSDIEEILLMSGYDPILINDESLVVNTVIHNKPDVILMELRIPHKNGFELSDTINRVNETNKIPIIAMSSFFKDEISWLLGLCGIKRWIKKPFQPLDVIWAIENEIEEQNQWNRRRHLSDIEIITKEKTLIY